MNTAQVPKNLRQNRQGEIQISLFSVRNIAMKWPRNILLSLRSVLDKLPGPCPIGLITSTEDVTLLSNSESHDSKLPSVNCHSLASCQEYCSLTAIPRSSAERDTVYDGLPEKSDVLRSPNYSDQHRALQLTRAIVMSCLDSWFSQTTGLAVISS